MSKSYMRIKDWPQGLPKEPRQDESWKSEVLEEMAEEKNVPEIFMVENEWNNNDGHSGHENVSAHLTVEDAEVSLWAQADSFGISLEEGQNSFDIIDNHSEYEFDVYFIGRYEIEEA